METRLGFTIKWIWFRIQLRLVLQDNKRKKKKEKETKEDAIRIRLKHIRAFRIGFQAILFYHSELGFVQFGFNPTASGPGQKKTNCL